MGRPLDDEIQLHLGGVCGAFRQGDARPQRTRGHPSPDRRWQRFRRRRARDRRRRRRRVRGHLFQAKYHHKNLDGIRGLPQSGVEKAVQAVRALFDPAAAVELHPRLEARISDIRSLIPRRPYSSAPLLLCSNGASWKVPEAQAIIDRENFGNRVTSKHRRRFPGRHPAGQHARAQDVLQFAGKAVVEDFNYARVYLGKMPVTELARLMEQHGDRLLERNIRRFLGLHGNRTTRRSPPPCATPESGRTSISTTTARR